MVYYEQRGEIFIINKNGGLHVFDVDNLEKGPKCELLSHASEASPSWLKS